MKPLIVANWKMNPPTLKEAKLLFNSVKKGLKNIKNTEVVICPPFIYIPTFQHSNIRTIKLGAQDCFWRKKGAFTGEISPKMLKNLGCEYIIVGHSERRALGETGEMINKKIKAAIKAKLKPILCIGETFKERKKGKTFKVLKNQLQTDLRSILNLKSEILNLIIAYEPVWAIGTGNPCDPLEAKKVLLFLRNFFKKQLILYGGSVNSKNATPYIKEGQFQGFIIGSASLKPQEFIKIVKEVGRA